ncbi:MAG: RnfABCDGE type electron transport complex subunit C, partial [Clostridiales bacterium]|nr:RnfABCDGE type electron transport complex subunit C [Clostridiales bacterium]
MSKTFRRGIHPPENKATSARPVEVVMPKEGEELIYPLVQHIGAPCNPIIKAGERVLVGQKIADCDAPVSSPIHASVSGTIKEVRPALTPSGQIVSSIIVVNDAKMEEIPMEGEEIVNYSKEQYLKIIREAGVVGLGGAGFPTHIKLNPPPSKKIEFLIVNASECEPYLTTDHRVLVEEAGKIRRGFSDMLKMFPTAKGIIAIETNKPDAIETMRSVCAGDANIEIVPLKPKYPQGSEKQLIFACTGREVP